MHELLRLYQIQGIQFITITYRPNAKFYGFLQKPNFGKKIPAAMELISFQKLQYYVNTAIAVLKRKKSLHLNAGLTINLFFVIN